MRITSNSYSNPYLNTLNSIQENKYKNEIRINTGQRNLSLTDSPKDVVNAKLVSESISRNKKYLNNIQEAYSEMQASNNNMESLQTKIQNIRQTAIDSTQTGNMGNLETLAIDVRGMINDVMRDVNADVNGKFLFSGTKTNPASLTEADGTTHKNPYELVQETPTTANPSGLVVKYYGNFKERSINKDATTTEAINATPDKMFGANGTEALQALIELYNVMAYREDGTARTKTDYYNKSDVANLDIAQQKLADASDRISKANSVIGSKTNRILAISDQITEENLRLKGVLSNVADTNYTETMLQLTKDQNALTYALKLGAQMNNNTLFDFLS